MGQVGDAAASLCNAFGFCHALQGAATNYRRAQSCKLLCHNLTCLIQEQETPGIIPVFWKDEPKVGRSDVLPMVRSG
jgi:hypothetical protein